MSKIIGDEKTIQKSKAAKPGAKYSFINWEAVDELPEQFEAVVTGVKFDLNKDFIKMPGNKYYPDNNLSYRIAEACGISGCEDSINEPLFADININPMFCKSLLDAPNIRNIQIGAKVTKRSKKQTEDGTFIYSSACTQEYNVWNRCMELWANEEQITKGYTEKNPMKGNYPYKVKYSTPYDRQSHFYSELKFATAKAETKAYCKSIRELASMPTGFEVADLAQGELIFNKVRRSSQSLKLEQAARLAALSSGIKPPEEESQMLFGEVKNITPDVECTDMLELMECYQELVNDDMLSKMIEWWKKTGGNDGNSERLQNVINKVKQVEQSLDAEQRIKHSLF